MSQTSTMRFIFHVISVSATLFCTIPGNNAKKSSNSLGMDKLRQDFLKLEESLWKSTQKMSYKGAKKGEDPEISLLRTFKTFDDQIQQEASYHFCKQDELREFFGNNYPYVHTDYTAIDEMYEYFRSFQETHLGLANETESSTKNRREWIDLTRSILDYVRNNVIDTLERLHRNITKNNLWLSSQMELEKEQSCDLEKSPQQTIYGVYRTLALTELKSHVMIQFCYMVKQLFGEGNYTNTAQNATHRYNTLSREFSNTVRPFLSNSSGELWRCDPEEHIEDETYVEVTRLIQAYIENEISMDSRQSCMGSCDQHVFVKSIKCEKGTLCQQQKICSGSLYNCQFISSDLQVCNSSDRKRRYDYIKYDNGRHLGSKSYLQKCDRRTKSGGSWNYWIFWECSYCLCLCDEQGMYSDRYVNLRASTSDMHLNKVVTGLRFVKHNKIIHLQIQQGQLLPMGRIDNRTLDWVPVEDYRITDRRIYEKQDYHTLKWSQRIVDLDDVMADPGYVVTGVRFKMIGTHLNFEILTTPFDFESGLLINPSHRSIYKDNLNTERIQLRLHKPDIPIKSVQPSIPSTSTTTKPADMYVEFTHSDLDKDIGQTTVPFFDAQKLATAPADPVPLGGAGVFHKGQKYYGGFLTPKIYTYDFSQHMN